MSRIMFLDTETTGLNPRTEQLFEIAVITLDGGEHVFRLKPDEATVRQMHPKAAEVNRYHERTAASDWRWDDPEDVADRLAELLHGAHIVGAVPDFDARFLDEWFDSLGLSTPRWHHHLIDVETLAVGWLAAKGAGIPLPWKSDELSRWCGVKPPSGDERHTALGDARWVRRWFERLMAGGAA